MDLWDMNWQDNKYLTLYTEHYWSNFNNSMVQNIMLMEFQQLTNRKQWKSPPTILLHLKHFFVFMLFFDQVTLRLSPTNAWMQRSAQWYYKISCTNTGTQLTIKLTATIQQIHVGMCECTRPFVWTYLYLKVEQRGKNRKNLEDISRQEERQVFFCWSSPK